MTTSALRRRAKEARRWLFDSCFPLWAEYGLTPAGLFPEVLSLTHDEVGRELTRVRVQARQTYVFAEAWRLGWKRDAAARLVQAGVSVVSGPALAPSGLPGRTLNAERGTLADASADLYDTAFVLFALAEAARGPLDPAAPLSAARQVLGALDQLMRDSEHGGYAEVLPAPTTRLQNPHMHLLEACLALHRSEPDAGHLTRAAEIVGLFDTKFTAGSGGLLGEKFAADWSAPGGDAARIVEPGHQFEWVWLLHTWSRLAQKPLPEAALRLYTFGVSTLDAAGRACQEVTRDGAPHDPSRRTWPQTEALKAHLALFEQRGEARFAAAACRSFDVLMDEFLTEDGGWIDHFAEDGSVLAKDMPASTGYHVVLALAELIRIMDA
ncbi:MAG: AGE family epimerase/isomerase [Alphaproteobacteria bacterium]|uniref:AGE family epimerase/isomerase n=1 Tax=Hyphomonas sp. TaxID=87 RepID=UPI001D6CA03E|nr:AGE family epimerase/isomerase [Hyphomonas sp.]MBU3921095.1 AGE family epimerase/isomerase [Alphaproteobacteria bacterium]MBU4062026.1 AGE family epimerase/isomerase [Alphaproteobacteria bacterium]MBU4164962.1 AGE family epimerase/isomerase [Alphaproteobacteria bacterium]MBU4568185.1 AGE family epimerase/isomerase [Alphaproteobacteria bacterium]